MNHESSKMNDDDVGVFEQICCKFVVVSRNDTPSTMTLLGLFVTLQAVGAASAFTCLQLSTKRNVATKRYLSDGNPPPFSSWGTPSSAPNPSVSPTPTVVDTTAFTGSSIGSNSNDPLAALLSSQSATMREILQGIPDLAPKPSLSWTEGSGADINGRPAVLAAYDAPGSSNIAWLADLFIPGKLSSLTIFNGPLTDVPHILSRCYLDDANQMLHLSIDVRPRAYGAYETKDPTTGSYPGPDELGRKAFEYSAARNEFFAYSGIDSLQSLLDPSQFENAIPGPPPNEYDILTGGPIALNICMPLTSSNIRKVAAIRECVAGAWCTWVTKESQQHMHRPGAPVNTQYVYDSKFRQNAYLALLTSYTQVFGNADGAKLAAAESGPLDEAYVGGGS